MGLDSELTLSSTVGFTRNLSFMYWCFYINVQGGSVMDLGWDSMRCSKDFITTDIRATDSVMMFFWGGR